MRMLVALLIVVTLAGCAGRQAAHVEPRPAGPVMSYDMEIPRRYQTELRGWTNGFSDCQRYMEAYGIGWDSEVCGWSDGYTSAEDQIQRNIKTFGPERTHAYLVEITEDVMGP
ncbi:MAG: hypothetical protein JW889_14080 [Verrucomicrobia bacterium]|nr:hypothetical protein [Verrucomicrobiota bacterium]